MSPRDPAGLPASASPALRDFEELLRSHSPGGLDALEESLAGLEATAPLTTWRVRFARLGRLVPRDTLAAGAIPANYPGLTEPRFFQGDVLARIAFLLHLDARLPQNECSAAVLTLFRTGSSREQASVLRALPWLPQGERFRVLASEAARTNDVDVFAALCIDNPFPAQFMEDHAFFQLVMKSMFLDQDTTRILGLARRANDELRRMAADYKTERQAAGRTVPAGVAWIEEAGRSG